MLRLFLKEFNVDEVTVWK